jgi:hypothetical protein
MKLKILRDGNLLKYQQNKIKMIWLGFSLKEDLANSKIYQRKRRSHLQAKRRNHQHHLPPRRFDFT